MRPWQPNLAGALAACLLYGCTPGLVRDGQGSDLGAAREPRPGDIYAQMGQEYLREGQPAVALRKLKRGLEVDPGNARIHAVMARLYEQLGEQGAAREHYAQATALEPQNPHFHNARGGFLCQAGEYAAADEQFRLALENPLYDRPWAANTNAGVCAYRAGRPAEAETYLRQALSANPRIPLALLKMAQLHAERQDYTTARDYLERYAQLLGHTPQTLALGVQIARGQGDEQSAARFRAELQRLYPDAPEIQTVRELPLP
jgi:type IV pilus assembly protein PilF